LESLKFYADLCTYQILQENKQLASKFLRGPFTNATIVANMAKNSRNNDIRRKTNTLMDFFFKKKVQSVGLRRPRPTHTHPPQATHVYILEF